MRSPDLPQTRRMFILLGAKIPPPPKKKKQNKTKTTTTTTKNVSPRDIAGNAKEEKYHWAIKRVTKRGKAKRNKELIIMNKTCIG